MIAEKYFSEEAYGGAKIPDFKGQEPPETFDKHEDFSAESYYVL